MQEGALSGFRVLDLTHHIAGPYCTRLMAGLGAEVLKIERPGAGDGARRIGPFFGDDPNPEKSGLFLYLNSGKKGLTLNLKTTTGVQMLKELVRTADVLVESFSPHVMSDLGLSYDDLEKLNPKLVMTSISSFGQTGPYREFKATELTEYAMSGLMFITGDPDREPIKVGGSLAQYLGGQYSFVATMGALLHAEMTGEGQHVDLSIHECCLGTLEFHMAQYFYRGHLPHRIGNSNEKDHPWGILPCRDGWVTVCARPRWKELIELMNIPELAEPRFSAAHYRIQNRDEVDALMIPWLLEHDKEEIYHLLNSHGIICGWVRSMDEIVNCTQLQSREYFTIIDHPATGAVLYPTAPYKLSETPWQARRAPLLGEHNEDVYCGTLGYNREDLLKMSEFGVI